MCKLWWNYYQNKHETKKIFRLDFAKEIKKKTNLKVGITGFTNDLKLADKYIKKITLIIYL